MTPFDNYEISPCVRLNDEGQPDPNGKTFEVCEPHEAHCWTLYGHIPGEGAMAIGDFATRKDAEEVFQRITGIPFEQSSVVKARLRAMHAGSELLEAAVTALPYVEDVLNDPGQLACFKKGTVQAHAKFIRSAIAEAEGRAA